MGSIPILETDEAVGTLIAEMMSQAEPINDDLVSQDMLRLLEKVVKTHVGFAAQGLVIERLCSNEAKLFKGVTGVAGYWLEITKHIMDDIDYTPSQKLMGTISLLRDEEYQ